MLRDLVYHLNRQIETHRCNNADRDDLRTLMSLEQLNRMERAMWESCTGPRQDPRILYSYEPITGSSPARIYGVEIVPTVMDMPAPLVVRLASI